MGTMLDSWEPGLREEPEIGHAVQPNSVARRAGEDRLQTARSSATPLWAKLARWRSGGRRGATAAIASRRVPFAAARQTNEPRSNRFGRRDNTDSVDSAVGRPYAGGASEGGRVATAQPVPLDGERELQRRENIFNALALGLLIGSAIVFLVAPALGFSTRGARISLMFSLVTLVLGLTSLVDAWLIKQHTPTFDVTLPPPISGWIGGVAAIAAGWLIGTTIFS